MRWIGGMKNILVIKCKYIYVCDLALEHYKGLKEGMGGGKRGGGEGEGEGWR